MSKTKLERVNLKIDLSFWTFLPYREPINYVINGRTFKPVSYRFLCLALIIVTSKDEVEQYDIGKINKKLKYD